MSPRSPTFLCCAALVCAVHLFHTCAWARRPPAPDDERDEQEMIEIKAALQADQGQRLQRAGSQRAMLAGTTASGAIAGGWPAALSPAPEGGLARRDALLPDLALVGDLLAGYSSASGIAFGGAVEIALAKAFDRHVQLDASATADQRSAGLLEVYATTLSLPFRLQLRGGLFLHRFGLHNAWHRHAWVLIEQPLALGRAFGELGGRGLGVEASWLLPLPWSVELSAAALSATGAETARSFY